MPDLSQMPLRMKQELFAKLVAKLIIFITAQPGYSMILGSTDSSRLGIEFNIFLHDQLLKKPEAMKFAGDFWTQLHPLCRWDGNLFFIEA